MWYQRYGATTAYLKYQIFNCLFLFRCDLRDDWTGQLSTDNNYVEEVDRFTLTSLPSNCVLYYMLVVYDEEVAEREKIMGEISYTLNKSVLKGNRKYSEKYHFEHMKSVR